ncbi:MAG TPA: lamin tail domain-containing protein, partial [Candidatus Paceibacterota bacterium]|nr:lamin tail domain-containing protein [Candidatus Paceibacterota bacterium]
MTNWNSPVHLRTFTATPALPVISEIDLAGQAIEITNPGDQLVDVSDWELQALNDYGTGVAPNARLRFPAGTVVPPRSAVVWTSRGVPPGAFPEFVSAKPFNAPSMFRLARLLDASGRIVDEVYARAMVSAPADAFWKGTGLANFPTNVTFQRVGYANHFRSVDWATNSPTRGSINASLILPWTEAGLWTSVSPSTVQVSNGVWTGSIILPQGSYGTNTLIADNGAGVSGKSAQFNVISKPALNLEI